MNDYLNVLRNHYADFRGRARRREYWMFTLVNAIIAFVLGLIDGVMGLNLGDGSQPVGLLGLIYSLVVLVPGLAVSVRRLHDTGRSGWWLLIGLIPFVGAIVLLIFTVSDSQPGPNRWGPNPKGQGANAAVDW